MSTDPQPVEAKPVSRRKLGFAGFVGLCAAVAIVVTGIMARAKTDTELKA